MKHKCTFTQSLIASAESPKGSKRIVLRDTQIAGLECRISSSGVKTFSIYRRVNLGKPERVTLGRFPTVSVPMARKLGARVNDAIAEGKSPAKVKKALRQELNFEQLYTEFLERHSKIKKRSWTKDVGLYNCYLKTTIGNCRLSDITRAQIATILSDVTKKQKKTKCPKNGKRFISGATSNRLLALISAVFNWGISVGLCEINPANRIKKNPEKSRDRFLQPDELPKFFEALEAEENTTIRDFVLISLLTGARRANVLSMRWEDISFIRKEWRIERTKNNDSQTVVLSKEVIHLLLRRREQSQSDFVFPGEGKIGHLVEPKKGWERILKRAGIEDLRIHDLRRTLGSWQARTGASLIVIGKSLGHKSLQATAVYSRLDLDPVRKSVETATDAMFSTIKRKKLCLIFNKATKNQIKAFNFSDLFS